MSVLLTDGYGFNRTNWDSLRIKHKVCVMIAKSDRIAVITINTDVIQCVKYVYFHVQNKAHVRVKRFECNM